MFLCLLCFCVYTDDVMRSVLPLIALLAFVSVYANQQRVKISPGFFTGKDYLDMSDTEQRAYTTGEINGMLVAPFFGAPEENLNWLKTCTGKMSDEQVASIVGKFIREQPDQLQANLNVVTFNALREACRKQSN
jgi:hypothetical protein